MGGGRVHPRREPKLNGLVKRLDSSRCDYLFVLVGDGRQWFIPIDEVAGGSNLVLGGPKYARFEVEPGRPIIEERAVALRAV